MVKKFLLRNIAMFLSLVMLISSTAQTTYGFISVASEPLVNTFVPGESLPPVEPEGKTDSVEICVKKTVVNTGKGEISPAGFSFNLVENKTGKTLTATSDENGDAKFVLEFSKADIGTTFEYSLSEKDTGKAGVTYSTDVFDIKIVVEENEEGNPDAKVVSSVTGETSDSASFGFTNEYHRDFISISIVAQKEFTSESEDHTLSGFVFILNGEEKTTGDDGRVVFDLEFTEPGTYVYELYEKDLGEEGMGYDTAVRTIEIVIAEQDGKLSAEINGVPGLSVTENFTNSYTGGTNPPIILGLVNFSVDAKVSIVNDTDPATPLDQFEIVGDGVTKVTDEEGRTTFYFEVEGELGEEFDFKFYQKPGDIEGLIYDVSENIVTVKFVDDGKGGATVEFYINGVLVTDLSDLTVYFVNRYPTQNEVSVTVEVEKFITNNSKTEVPADVNFSFNLTDKETGEVIDFVNVEGTGRKAFGDLVFTEEDLGTHYYTISEVKGSAEGFEYSTEIHELTVTVSKDGEGKVFAKVLLNGTENTLATFTNVYNGPKPEAIKLPITINKEIIGGKDKISPEEFEFTIENLTKGTSKKVRTDAKGVFTDYLEFGVENEGKTIEYRIKEVKGSRKDVQYDDTVYNVSIKIEKVNGELKANVSVNGFVNSGNLNFCFKNVYKGSSVNPPSEEAIIVPVVIEKTVISGGNKELGPENFEFVLEHYQKYNEENYCEYKTTDVNGKATFNLVFDKEDVGNIFEYRVYEINEKIPGIKYDDTVYEIWLAIYRDDLGRICAYGKIINGEEETPVSIETPKIVGSEENKKTEENPEIVLEFTNEYNIGDEGNPETGFYTIAEGLIAMVFSGSMFILLVLTDKRFKIK